ncbi:ATP synthase [Actinoplanes sp. SE50]|uniref:tetratricopeptide repeat protein n=1 Tax=unclassified Actinoplanes TaxID=2626549 RepID=UPI00023ED4F8|nr:MULTISPECIES: tetratricopeptide repeat protein [unclassified Actinoplanes]AEV87863.1 putative ATP/GTP binding protein [Actinoplanes sp. SE50/110]ATO86265.1 ATP synthase [Actinoplanes sp. SE50]SLM03680.1 ATP synthase [Actinoplanes sp. SE50/110]
MVGSGDACADRGGIANTGIYIDLRPAPSRPDPVWPIIEVSSLPVQASAFQPRPGLRQRVEAAHRAGRDVVLTQPDQQQALGRGTQVLAGGGGVGKSQLAAWFARQAIAERTDVVVWVNAASTDQIVTTYAAAATKVAAPGADGTDPATDAKAFLSWLRTTDRAWLVVLDDITDPAQVRGWWPPHGRTGWTLATTRRRDAVLTGGGRHRIDVDVYSPTESVAYLAQRLTDGGCLHLFDESTAHQLGMALGHLPLALSHAAAYMIDQEESCAAYLDRYTSAAPLAKLMPAEADSDDYGIPVAVTLLLGVDAADQREPVGLARPALGLAALLDPAGHPDTLWTTTAVTDYLASHRSTGAGVPVTAEQARQVLRLLDRYGLIAHTSADTARSVRIHAQTARATRETLTDPSPVAQAAADALRAVWPDIDHGTTDLITALRSNTTTLAEHAGDLLWHPDGPTLLYRAGISLLNAGLHTTAVAYWQHMTDQATRLLGDDHPDTLTARASLAASYRLAGRTADAIALEEQVLVDTVRVLGEQHPGTLRARGNLAASYRQAGHTADAIGLEEQVLVDTVRVLGEQHPDTLIARGNLAASYRQAGRTADAIGLEEQVLVDTVRVLGEQHPDTLIARGNLAASYRQAGHTADAIALQEQVLVDTVRVLGEQHPETVAMGEALRAWKSTT